MTKNGSETIKVQAMLVLFVLISLGYGHFKMAQHGMRWGGVGVKFNVLAVI